jgi:hypothetical protein
MLKIKRLLFMNIDKLYNYITLWHDTKELPIINSKIIVKFKSLNDSNYSFARFFSIRNEYFLTVTTPDSDIHRSSNIAYIPFNRVLKWMYLDDFQKICE